ncbi:MAG: hypothetical protein H7Y18_14575 [Clostridiaceae bacterium]|nr:hypothetical protein [Clostridiaceae bacterium]
MEDKIKVLIYGNKESKPGENGGCGHLNEAGCTGCNSDKSSGCGEGKCGSKEKKSQGNMFLELESFIDASDIKNKVKLYFIELDNKKIGGNEEIQEIIDRGFEAPIVVIDGIVRYFGGISNLLIYNDIKELLQ